VSASVRVIPIGNQVSFDFGTTQTGTATSEHIVFYGSGSGINRKIPIFPVEVKSDAAKPMKVSVFSLRATIEGQEWRGVNHEIKKLWGNTTDSKIVDFAGVDCAMRHFNSYMGYGEPYSAETGTWRMDRMLDVIPANAVMGTPIIDWSYKPRNGLQKPWKAQNYKPFCFPSIVGIPKDKSLGHFYELNDTSADLRALRYTTDDKKVQTLFDYDSVAIENVDIINTSFDLNGEIARADIDLPVFGTMPILTTMGTDADSDWVRIMTYWQVETSITIETPCPSIDHTTKIFHDMNAYAKYTVPYNKRAPEADRFYFPSYYGLGVYPNQSNMSIGKYDQTKLTDNSGKV